MKKNQTAFLLLNGEAPKTLPNLSKYDIICTTDGAYEFAQKNQITPDFVSGDFDSIRHIPKDIETIHTPDQNFTDFDKALQILYKKGFTKVDVFGASGKEQDHFLGNLHCAYKWKKKIDITFFDNHGYYFFASKITVLHNVKNKTISLYPFPKASKIITKGLQYIVNNEDLSIKKRIGTRNVAIKNEINITFKKGELIIFVNN